MNLGKGIDLPADAVTQTFAVLAVRGAGKSNLGAVMAEEMFKAGLPFVVIDPVSAWWGLRAAGTGPGISIPIFGGRRGDVPLERTAGVMLADLVASERLSCVLDLSDFSEGDKTRFLIDFAERLYRKNTDPLHVFLEEADDYIPQKPFRDQARLLRAWENVVRRGRGRGLGMTMITQRSASINKSVLTQAETLFVLRTTSPQDRKAIEAWIEYHGQSREVLESLRGLETGEAWVWSPQYLKVCKRVRIRQRRTFDSGATPKMSGGKKKPATLADVDLGAIEKRMKDTIERAKADDPKVLRARIAELEKQVAQKWEVKVEPVEVPVIGVKELGDLQLFLEMLPKVVAPIAEGLRKVSMYNERAVSSMNRRIKVDYTANGKKHSDLIQIDERNSLPVHLVQAAERRATMRTPVKGQRVDLPVGERKILTVIAQHLESNREQISVMTGYKRSSRDAYLARLKQRGLIVIQGDRIYPEPSAKAALGPDYEPLPVGHRLREHWLDTLPEGESRIFKMIIESHPGMVERDEISNETGYKRSSRDAYIQRLKARRLVEVRDGGVVASEHLFTG